MRPQSNKNYHRSSQLLTTEKMQLPHEPSAAKMDDKTTATALNDMECINGVETIKAQKVDDVASLAESEYEWKTEDPPNAPWVPFLEIFSLFTELPIELRQRIWQLTLEPRVLEIQYKREKCQFFTKAAIPVALRACQDSRAAVAYLYPMCFDITINQPSIVFNGSIDILYFDSCLGPELTKFVLSLRKADLSRIQFVAVHRLIDLGEDDEKSEDGLFYLTKASKVMPNLKEVMIVLELDDDHHDHGVPYGTGPMKLYKKIPWELAEFCGHGDGLHCDDEDGASECGEMPDMSELLKGLDSSNVRNVWGWRPTEINKDVDYYSYYTRNW